MSNQVERDEDQLLNLLSVPQHLITLIQSDPVAAAETIGRQAVKVLSEMWTTGYHGDPIIEVAMVGQVFADEDSILVWKDAWLRTPEAIQKDEDLAQLLHQMETEISTRFKEKHIPGYDAGRPPFVPPLE